MGSWQTLAETSIGTAVARTQIAAATSKPTQSRELVEFVPYMALNGLTTTVESVTAEIELTSDSINMLPKRAIVPPIMAGLSTVYPTLIPILQSYACHTPVKEGSSQQVSAFGTPQVANTVAPLMGVSLHYSTARASLPWNEASLLPEMFYDKPANETAIGTAATTVTGNTIQVNGGVMLQSAYFYAAPTTPTIGDSLIGEFAVSSNDFQDSSPLDMPMQPVGAFLGATSAMLLPKLTQQHNLAKGMKSSCLISTSARFGIAQAGNGTFIHGIGYQKSMTGIAS